MALIIEDGSLVEGAMSYIDVAYLRTYAAQRGRTVPADDTACEVVIVKGMDKLESYEDQFAGFRTYGSGETAWPRTGVPGTTPGAFYGSTVIPEKIKRAQAEFALASAEGTDLQPTRESAAVISETVGPISTTYASGDSASYAPIVAAAEALLKGFFRTGGLLRTVRA